MTASLNSPSCTNNQPYKTYTMTVQNTGNQSHQVHIKGNINQTGQSGTENFIEYGRNISANSSYTFNYVRPGKYTFRLIEDLNSNDMWDTGNYIKRKQPEPVYYFPSEIDVRANWDLNETFNLNSDDSIF